MFVALTELVSLRFFLFIDKVPPKLACYLPNVPAAPGELGIDFIPLLGARLSTFCVLRKLSTSTFWRLLYSLVLIWGLSRAFSLFSSPTFIGLNSLQITGPFET